MFFRIDMFEIWEPRKEVGTEDFLSHGGLKGLKFLSS